MSRHGPNLIELAKTDIKGAAMRRASILAMAAVLFVAIPVPVRAHQVERVISRSICNYEERYYIWTPGEPWRVTGRVEPRHRDMRVILQKSKYGHRWTTWKTARTFRDGTFRFRGIAPDRGAGWWVNLRVVAPAHLGYRKVVGLSMYIDTNPYGRCV